VEHLAHTLIGDAISSQEVVAKVDSYIEDRFRGTAKDTNRLRHGGGVDAQQLRDRIQGLKDQGKRVFALFPNIMWDVATTFDGWNRVFDSPVEWLVETVRYFAAANDKVLIIRVHPGEHTLTVVRKSIRDILEHYLGVEIFASPNIIFVPASAKVASYQFFDLLDGGVVYNGTIALELIHYGVPVLVGAKAAYSDKGFTYDINNRGEYFDCFDRTEAILAAQAGNLNMAKYFIYEYFFLHGVPVQLMSSSKFLSPNLEASPERIWNDRKLDHIIKVIVGEEKYFQDHWMQSEV
jgi:hypothetical protein